GDDHHCLIAAVHSTTRSFVLDSSTRRWIGVRSAINATMAQTAIPSIGFTSARREIVTRRKVAGGRTTTATTSPATTAIPATGCFAGPDEGATTTRPPATPPSR